MRKRGFLLILIAIPAWVFLLRAVDQIMKTPFGYELGSVAFPMPPFLKIAGMFTLLLTIVGLLVLVFDLVRYFRGRFRAQSRI